MEKMTPLGWLKFRVEGNNWQAYYAVDAVGDVWLGGIRLDVVKANSARKDAFMALMKDAVSDIVEAVAGAKLAWGEAQAAPEHERAGRA